MVNALEALPEVTGVSPEVFAFSSWNGKSFVIRGVVLDKLNATGPDFKKFMLTGTTSVQARESALIGARLQDRLGLSLPCALPVVGSYSSKIEFLNVVGRFETGSSLDDEILASLEVARFLSGMSSDKVSIIRVATSDPEWLSNLLSPEGPRFVLFDLLSQKTYAAVEEEVGLSVGVRNWGTEKGSINISFFDGDNGLAEVSATLNASQTDRIAQTVNFDTLGLHTVNVSIGGDFPVTLSINITVVDPYLRLAAPSKVALGENFTVKVTTHQGSPREGAKVTFGSQTNFTDPYGNTTLLADQVGTFQVTANTTGYADARATVMVQDPSTYPPEFQPSIVSFTLSPGSIRETESATGVIVLENNGSLPGNASVTVLVDSAPYLTVSVYLDGLESKSFTFKVSRISAGTHSVQVGSFANELVVVPWYAENPDFVQIVMRYSSSSSLFSAGSLPIYQAAKISEGNVSIALFAIGATAGLLALLAITSVFSKEIHEARRRLGILKTIGASRAAIRKIVFPQALENSLGGAALGVAFGVIITDMLSSSGVFVLFGHQFQLDLNTGLLILLLAGAVVISVASALASAMMAVRETTIRSIRRLQEEPPEPIDVEKIIGDD